MTDAGMFLAFFSGALVLGASIMLAGVWIADAITKHGYTHKVGHEYEWTEKTERREDGR